MAGIASKRVDGESTLPDERAPAQRKLESDPSSHSIIEGHLQTTADDIEAQHKPAGIVTKVLTTDLPYTTFTSRQKALLVFVSTLGACFSPFTANIYFPAIDTISNSLGVTTSKVNLTITTYMIFQGIAPSFTSAIADEYGRRPAYVIGFAIYMIANLGLGLNNSYTGLMVLRCIQSSGSSGLATLNQGTIADIITSGERGKYISITSIASVLAPSVAPIAGGLLAGTLGWHSIFWFLLIASGVYFVPLVLFFPETGRKVVGDGSINPPKWNRCLTDLIRERKADKNNEKDIAFEQQDGPSSTNAGTNTQTPVLPKKKSTNLNFLASLSIIADPETALILLTAAIVYAAFYAISTSLTVQFGRIYNLDSTLQGLLFLPQAIGSIFAAIFNSKMVDRRYRHHAAQAGVPIDRTKQIDILRSAMPIERPRIEIALPMITISCLAMIVYGWLLEAETHIAGPIVMLVVIGFTTLSGFGVLSVLLIDLHRSRSATASAASNLVRCLLGAGASAVINPLIEAIGLGWSFTLVGLLGLASLPMLVVCAVYGPGMRRRRREKEDRQVEVREREKGQASDMGGMRGEKRGRFDWLYSWKW